MILLSGGPGTGKTSTILQMLENALFLYPNLNIGLAAPTGKAARRLQDSLHKGIATITSSYQKKLSEIPCNTLHRWLQANPNGYAKNKQNPLNLDLLVIDEMSMVDLLLMKALLDALPKNNQLVLVGDPNQLPPIGNGAIWHQLQKNDIRKHFGNGAIHLRQTYRNRGEIASSSQILCEQGMCSFLENISQLQESANIQTHPSKLSSIPTLLLKRLKGHSKRLEKLTNNIREKLPRELQLSCIDFIDIENESKELFECLEELMVLCPKRYGLWGVDEVHKVFLSKTIELGLSNWPQGTPVMCSENQPELQLSNGDVGLVIGEGDNRRLLFRIALEGGALTPKFIHPARLKTVEPALAMTIHKAQGSEANEVIVLLPGKFTQTTQDNERGKEKKSYEERLLYTAITRARSKVNLIIEATD